MFDFLNSNEFWLMFTNVALGVLTLICLATLVRAVVVEVFERRKATSWISKLADDHAFFSSELGVTMADGGQRIDDQIEKRLCVMDGFSGEDPEDEKNIIRSEN